MDFGLFLLGFRFWQLSIYNQHRTNLSEFKMYSNNFGQNMEGTITEDLIIKAFQMKLETKFGLKLKDKYKIILKNM